MWLVVTLLAEVGVKISSVAASSVGYRWARGFFQQLPRTNIFENSTLVRHHQLVEQTHVMGPAVSVNTQSVLAQQSLSENFCFSEFTFPDASGFWNHAPNLPGSWGFINSRWHLVKMGTWRMKRTWQQEKRICLLLNCVHEGWGSTPIAFPFVGFPLVHSTAKRGVGPDRVRAKGGHARGKLS